MIRTYGLFWNREKVYWGRQGDPGSLWGTPDKTAKAQPVDFREQGGIYALYSNYELVYIGQTGSGSQRLLYRLRSHLDDHLADRWNQFSWFGTQWVTKRNKLSTNRKGVSIGTPKALHVLEAVSIAIAEPRLNLQRGNWDRSGAAQYFQHRDPRLKSLEEEVISAVDKAIEAQSSSAQRGREA